MKFPKSVLRKATPRKSRPAQLQQLSPRSNNLPKKKRSARFAWRQELRELSERIPSLAKSQEEEGQAAESPFLAELFLPPLLLLRLRSKPHFSHRRFLPSSELCTASLDCRKTCFPCRILHSATHAITTDKG